METIPALRALFQAAHEFFDGTLAGVTSEQAAWEPPGAPASIAAQCAHVFGAEDMGIHVLLGGGAPLYETAWAGKAGWAAAPPLYPGADVKGWARTTPIHFDALRSYGAAVHAATDAYPGATSMAASSTSPRWVSGRSRRCSS